MLCGDLKGIKVTQITFLETKYPVSEIKNTVDYVMDRLYTLQKKRLVNLNLMWGTMQNGRQKDFKSTENQWAVEQHPVA